MGPAAAAAAAAPCLPALRGAVARSTWMWCPSNCKVQSFSNKISNGGELNLNGAHTKELMPPLESGMKTS